MDISIENFAPNNFTANTVSDFKSQVQRDWVVKAVSYLCRLSLLFFPFSLFFFFFELTKNSLECSFMSPYIQRVWLFLKETCFLPLHTTVHTYISYFSSFSSSSFLYSVLSFSTFLSVIVLFLIFYLLFSTILSLSFLFSFFDYFPLFFGFSFSGVHVHFLILFLFFFLSRSPYLEIVFSRMSLLPFTKCGSWPRHQFWWNRFASCRALHVISMSISLCHDVKHKLFHCVDHYHKTHSSGDGGVTRVKRERKTTLVLKDQRFPQMRSHLGKLFYIYIHAHMYICMHTHTYMYLQLLKCLRWYAYPHIHTHNTYTQHILAFAPV